MPRPYFGMLALSTVQPLKVLTFTKKDVAHIWSLPFIYIFVLKIYLELRVLLWYQLTTIVINWKKNWVGPPMPPVIFLLFIIGNKLLNHEVVEFDFNIGHALVFFPFLWIINNKMEGEPCTPPTNPPKLIYFNIYIYIVHNKLFSPNLRIIITDTFKNTSIPLKLYEITLFPTGSSAYYSIESAESSLCWWHMNFKYVPWDQFSS